MDYCSSVNYDLGSMSRCVTLGFCNLLLLVSVLKTKVYFIKVFISIKDLKALYKLIHRFQEFIQEFSSWRTEAEYEQRLSNA